MKRLVAISFGVLISFAAHAQDSKRESIEELLEVSKADTMVDAMYGQVQQAFAGVGDQLGIRPDEQPMFDAYMNKLFSAMKKDMSWEKMKEPVIQIYMKHYTEKEVQDMLVFYRSETGQAMIEKMPAVVSDSMQVGQSMMQNFIPKIGLYAEELQQDLEEHRKKQDSQ